MDKIGRFLVETESLKARKDAETFHATADVIHGHSMRLANATADLFMNEYMPPDEVAKRLFGTIATVASAVATLKLRTLQIAKKFAVQAGQSMDMFSSSQAMVETLSTVKKVFAPSESKEVTEMKAEDKDVLSVATAVCKRMHESGRTQEIYDRLSEVAAQKREMDIEKRPEQMEADPEKRRMMRPHPHRDR